MESTALNTANQNTNSTVQNTSTQNTSTNTNPTSQTTTDSSQSTDTFTAFLQQALGKSGTQEVNEEELFTRVIAERLNEQDPEAAAFYQEQVNTLSSTMARADGYVPLEDVAKAALKATVDAGKISEDKAMVLHAEAFCASQLDGITTALYDGRGTTSAVSSMEEAMFKVKACLDEIKAGTKTVEPRSLDIESNHGPVEGDPLMKGGASATEATAGATESDTGKSLKFSWKHIASDGNLAVIIPQPLSDGIDSVDIIDSEGNQIERGDYSKTTGDHRAVYRFNEPGGEYGKNVRVVITRDDGRTITYKIPNGNERNSEFLEGSAEDRIDKTPTEVKTKKKTKSGSSSSTGSTSSTSSSSSNTNSAADSSASTSNSSSSSSSNSEPASAANA